MEQQDQARKPVNKIILTKQQVLSNIITLGLPILLSIGLMLSNPGYASIMIQNGLGQIMLGAAALILILGGIILFAGSIITNFIYPPPSGQPYRINKLDILIKGFVLIVCVLPFVFVTVGGPVVVQLLCK
ncbi:MAG: hypothetical protein WC552_08475 [Candidatus Omnitrophota bacterium]